MKPIQRVIRHVPQHWVGDGFPVRSLFSYRDGEAFDPFLLLDFAGPHAFAPGERPRGVGEHPHRGFETVTIVYQGELEHRDSAGNRGSIAAGDVQWMTAAGGIVHEEFHSERMTREGGVLEMIQLWVNLPAKDKLSPPSYQEILSEQIPVVPLPADAGTLRVIAGSFHNTPGPAKTHSPIELWDLQLVAGGFVELSLPAEFTTLLVVQSGSMIVSGSDTVNAAELVLFERVRCGITLHVSAQSRALLLAGKPLGEPVVGQGPFVMNTREQIEQAIADYREGRMGRLM